MHIFFLSHPVTLQWPAQWDRERLPKVPPTLRRAENPDDREMTSISLLSLHLLPLPSLCLIIASLAQEDDGGLSFQSLLQTEGKKSQKLPWDLLTRGD